MKYTNWDEVLLGDTSFRVVFYTNCFQSTVSGLNKGLAASENDLQKANDVAKEIEEAGGHVDLSVDLDKLQRRWKLIYSIAFSSRTLGESQGIVGFN